MEVKNKFYNTGKHKWTHGQIVDWAVNREPLRWLLGPCPCCGAVTSNYGLGFNCHEPYCRNSANVFVCSTADPVPDWWETDVDVYFEDDVWSASFENCAAPEGFGLTPNEAVKDLREKMDNYDGAPYCSFCGAKEEKFCDCGPIADND